jgi:hypothetical protein
MSWDLQSWFVEDSAMLRVNRRIKVTVAITCSHIAVWIQWNNTKIAI